MHMRQALSIAACAAGLAVASTPPDFSPRVSRDVIASYGGSNVVLSGNELAQTAVVNAPTLYAFPSISPSAEYLVAMLDISINTAGVASDALHWLQPDLKLDPSSGELVVANASDSAAPYIGPQPTPGPAHEFVIVIYQQPAGYVFPACFAGAIPLQGRKGFNLPEFVAAAGLGSPVAANWFRVQSTTPATTTYAVTSTSISSYACGATS